MNAFAELRLHQLSILTVEDGTQHNTSYTCASNCTYHLQFQIAASYCRCLNTDQVKQFAFLVIIYKRYSEIFLNITRFCGFTEALLVTCMY
jgi:hypothetical protein